MDAIEMRAREIYADQFPGDAGYETREWIMAGTWGDDEVIAAIIAALTPPEGYVLVPVETLEEITHYAEGYVSTHDFVLMRKERKMLHVRKAQEILSSCPEVP